MLNALYIHHAWEGMGAYAPPGSACGAVQAAAVGWGQGGVGLFLVGLGSSALWVSSGHAGKGLRGGAAITSKFTVASP